MIDTAIWHERPRTGLKPALAGLALVLLSPLAAVAAQPAFPVAGKPIHVVVPAPPGGPGDFVARMLAERLYRQWPGNPVIVENRAGGASVLAANSVVKAAPDGHTVLLALNTTHTQVPYLLRSAPFDPEADFTPIATVYQAQSVVVAHPSLAANDLREAVALSGEKGPIAGGSASPGTNSHLYLEILNGKHDADFNHIPYKGSAPALRDLLAGFTQIQFDSPSSSLPYVKDGRLKALAVTGSRRLAALPDVPTGAEQGFPELTIGTWMALFGPAGLSAETLQTWSDAVQQALADPELARQFQTLGLEVVQDRPEDLAARVKEDGKVWGDLIRALDIKLD